MTQPGTQAAQIAEDSAPEVPLSDGDDVEAALEAALEAEFEGVGEEEAPGVAPAPPSGVVTGLGGAEVAIGAIDLSQMTKQQRAELNTHVVSMLDGVELDRYEAFRRSSLKKPMQRVMHIVTGVNPKPQDKSLIALASVAKSFVGQLVETARMLAAGKGEEGPLQPMHIHAAYQQLIAQGKVEGLPKKPRRIL
ncbi:hypothetical protein ACKKBF_B20825 [Auxenochlorella protothecoides x Auxenochlorella symbiontica]